MSQAYVTQPVFEDSGFSLMARVYGTDGTLIEQADITSITLTVFNKETGAVIGTANTALTVADVVFDTLQTDARWTKDSTGYNFRADLLATYVPSGGPPESPTMERFELKFTPATGQVFHIPFDVPVLNLFGS